MIRRCTFCHGRIWPWQHIGWMTTSSGPVYWHPQCRREWAARVRE